MSPTALLFSAWEEVRTQWTRTALTMLTVVVGVWALTAIVALGESGRAAVRADIERQFGRPATLQLMVTSPEDGSALFSPELRSMVAARGARYGSPAVAALESITVPVGTAGSNQGTELVGTSPILRDIRRFALRSGRWLEPSDAAAFAPRVVANVAFVAQALGGEGGDPMTIRLRTTTPVDARMVGQVDDGEQRPRLYIPLQVMQRWQNDGTAEKVILLRTDPAQVGALKALLTRDVSRFLPGSDVEVRRIDDADRLTNVISVVQLVLGLVAVIALLTGALGILNIGLVTVRQRVREFGIRRSFGATRRDIFTLVLTESLLTTAVAGAMAVVLAALSSLVIPTVLASSVSGADVPGFPVGSAAVGFGTSLVVGVAAGLVPAAKATRESIITAIRR